MTSRFRLLLAAIFSALAIMTGWVTGFSSQEEPPAGRRSGLAIPVLAATEDVDRYAQAIFASDLFPNASLRVEGGDGVGQSGEQNVEEFERSLHDPSLSAFVKREDAWRIILYGVGEGAQVREVGDQLSDGWVIQGIDSTSVLLMKGEQTRRIEVFKAEPDTQ